MASSIIYLSDCTPLYTTLGAPARVPSVSGYPLNRSARLEWPVPPNTENILVDSYIVRYKLTGAPISQTLNELLTFFPSVIISGLSNGVSYDFWVVAKNRFGESPHSPTISVTPGAAPSAIQVVRRAYHSTTVGNGIDGSNNQKVGIEFTPSFTQNGAQSLTFTAKYTHLNSANTIYSEVYSIQTNEIMVDASGTPAINTNGVKGNYIRKEITPFTGAPGFQSGLYRFQVFSSNIYGISALPDLSFVIQLYSSTDANTLPAIARFTSPTFAFASYSVPANGGIVSITPGDTTFQFCWKQYRGPGTGSTGVDAYSGWVYRIQYTDDSGNWYYPPVSVSMPETAKFPEYTIAYDRTSQGSGTADFKYFIDISRNVINGRRYYVRYCVVNAAGDTSEYTQVTSSNLSLVSAIPGKLPNPPPIFNASSGDRLVKLYFDWKTRPPSLDVTGGLPILDYRIERYISANRNAVFDNIAGPYYEDTFDMRMNGIEYEYRVFSRNAFGLSTNYTKVTAIPSRKSDVVRNVTASVDSGQITLAWNDPTNIDSDTSIVQYYIEYKEFSITAISGIPVGNVVGTFSGQTTISNTVQDMNSILVDDALWAKLPPFPPLKPEYLYTNSLNRSYTISGLINYKALVFRVAAVTQDRARRKLVGLIKVIGPNSPYLQHPVIIGKVPTRLTSVEYINGDSNISIKWSSRDINNTEGIIRFIVEYDTVSGRNNAVYSQRQTFDYMNSVVFNDGSTTVTFNVIIYGLNNNVPPEQLDPSMNSYVMRIYAENSVGFTNTENRVILPYDVSFTDIFEGLTVPRVLRPRTIPSIISEIRT
jgi:hypothetical protein